MVFEKNKSRLITLIISFILASVFMLFLPGKASALTAEDAAAATKKGWHALPGGGYTYMLTKTKHASGFVKLGKKWYHFDDEGYLSLEWFEVDGKKYYAYAGGKLGKKKGSLRSGYAKADGKYYYFSETDSAGKFGVLTTGWVTYKNKTYYYTKEAEKLTGLQKIKGNLYYFNPKGSEKKTGRLKTGWKTIDGSKYYFRKTGTVGKKYGAAYKNTTVKIDGKKCTFDKTGALTVQEAGTEAQRKFIAKIGPMAHEDMLSTGILASVTIAQACIESGYGTSTLATKAKNLFGMKASIGGSSWKTVWKGKTYTVNTQEYINGSYITIKAAFRKYSTIAESVADHSAYLAGATISEGKLRYDGIVGCKKYKKAAQIIKDGGYATAPNYVPVIVNTIETFNLTQYD